MVNALKTKKLKMVAETVKKVPRKIRKDAKKADLLSIHHRINHIYSNTSFSTKKSKFS